MGTTQTCIDRRTTLFNHRSKTDVPYDTFIHGRSNLNGKSSKRHPDPGGEDTVHISYYCQFTPQLTQNLDLIVKANGVTIALQPRE
jgi:hypothetical protein